MPPRKPRAPLIDVKCSDCGKPMRKTHLEFSRWKGKCVKCSRATLSRKNLTIVVPRQPAKPYKRKVPHG